MCTTSVIHEFMQQHHPLTDPWWTPQKLNEYEEIINRLDVIDKQLNLPVCDPEKQKFMDDVRAKLSEIEKKLGINAPQQPYVQPLTGLSPIIPQAGDVDRQFTELMSGRSPTDASSSAGLKASGVSTSGFGVTTEMTGLSGGTILNNTANSQQTITIKLDTKSIRLNDAVLKAVRDAVKEESIYERISSRFGIERKRTPR